MEVGRAYSSLITYEFFYLCVDYVESAHECIRCGE